MYRHKHLLIFLVIFFCGLTFFYVNKEVFRRRDLFQKLTIFVEVKTPVWTDGSKFSQQCRVEMLDPEAGGGAGFVRQGAGAFGDKTHHA